MLILYEDKLPNYKSILPYYPVHHVRLTFWDFLLSETDQNISRNFIILKHFQIFLP